MAFDRFSELFTDFSIQDIVNGDFSVLLPILYLVVSMAIYSIIIWHFYRYIARRDCFRISTRRHPKIIGFCKYFLAYPLVAFLFFTFFSVMLLFMTRNYELSGVLSTSFAIVAAIRITSYYSEDLSRDVAKMLPFALLGVVIVDPSYFNVSDLMAKISTIPEFFSLCVQFILFIIILEWILRSLLTVKHALGSKKKVVTQTPQPNQMYYVKR